MPHPIFIFLGIIVSFLIGFKFFSETWLNKKELEVRKDGKWLEITLYPHGSWILGLCCMLLSIPFIYFITFFIKAFPFKKMMDYDPDAWVFGLFVIFILFGIVRNAWSLLSLLPKLFIKAQILKIEGREIRLISKGFFKTREEKLLISNIEKFAIPYYNEYQKTDAVFKYLFHSGIAFYLKNRKKEVFGLYFVHLKFLLELVEILKSRGFEFDADYIFEEK